MLGQYETKISKNNLNYIINRSMSPSEIIDFLEDDRDEKSEDSDDYDPYGQ